MRFFRGWGKLAQRQFAREHFVKDNPQRKDVGPVISPFSAGLFGRRIGGRPIRDPDFGDLRPVQPLHMLGGLILDQLREPEIQ